MFEEYESFFFDCDGVILDSNEIKTKAFRDSLKGEPEEYIDQFIKYHQENQGIDRYKKLKYYFSDIKKISNFEKNYLDCLKVYADLCKKELIKANYVIGVEKYLKKIKDLGKQMYVVSGSDHDELNQIFKIRKLDSYFNEIYGSPMSKIDILNELCLNSKMPGIYFGDSKSDMNAALKYDLFFVYVYEHSNWSDGREICKASNIMQIKNFDQIL